MNEKKFYEVLDRIHKHQIETQLRKRDQMPFYVKLVVLTAVLMIVLAAIAEASR